MRADPLVLIISVVLTIVGGIARRGRRHPGKLISGRRDADGSLPTRAG